MSLCSYSTSRAVRTTLNRGDVNALVVEGDEGIRQELVELFEQEGFAVRQTDDSSQAVTMVMERQPSVVVIAEDMPTVDTLELLTLIRRLTTSPIIVTGSGDDMAVVMALLQGADVYMRKPINYREMLTRVRALLR